jgi:hypothetical protein
MAMSVAPNFVWTWRTEDKPPDVPHFSVEDVARRPHLLGHIAGKTKLTALHDDWIHYIWDSNEERALQAHRGSYKTTGIHVIGTVRWMLFNPDDRVAIVRKTFTDAAQVVDSVRRIMDLPEVQMLFELVHGFKPKTILRRYGELTYNFKKSITPEASLTAHGLDGSLTGKHYDKILCDDFVTLKDRISRAERERTAEIMREILTNIIDPGKGLGFTGTPWHERDAWGVIPVAPLLYPVGACGILSRKDIEHKKKVTTPFLYAANYDLKLQTEEGQLFADPVMGGPWDITRGNPEGHLDAAFDGDHTCAMTFLRRRVDGGFDGLGWVYDGHVKQWMSEIARLYKRYRVKRLHVETNADKGYVANDLRAYNMVVKEYAEAQNKHIKISTRLFEAWDQIEWAEETDGEYLAQMTDYREKQEPDDAPDSAASLLRQAFHPQGKANAAMYTL